MGCRPSSAAAVDAPRAPLFGRCWRAQVVLQKSPTEVDVDQHDTLSENETLRQVHWQRILAPIAASFEANESQKPKFWWISGLEDIVFDDPRWRSTFRALHDKPVPEIAGRLTELGTRAWQKLWAQYASEFEVAAREMSRPACSKLRDVGVLSPTTIVPERDPADDSITSGSAGCGDAAGGKDVGVADASGLEGSREGALEETAKGVIDAGIASTDYSMETRMMDAIALLAKAAIRRGTSAEWEDACRLLQQVVNFASGRSSPRLGPHELESVVDAIGADTLAASLRTMIFAARRQLALQEELTWLARVVATSVSSHEFYLPFMQTVQKHIVDREQAGWLGRVDDKFSLERLRLLLREGIELFGVRFRCVYDDADWREACAEIRHSRWIPSSRLVVAVEGLGVRLVAVPCLQNTPDGAITTVARDACHAWALRHLAIRGISLDDAASLDLKRWCASLPNPRQLLCVETPLAAAAAAMSTSTPVVDAMTRFALVVCAGSTASETQHPAESFGITGAYPCVVSAASKEGLLEKAAQLLMCSPSDLKLCSGQIIFGCLCDVWYRPENQPERRETSVWSWRSDNFTLIFEPSIPPNTNLAALTKRLAATAAYMRHHVSFLHHPRSVRSALRKHGVSSRFALALAEPQLLPGTIPHTPVADASMSKVFDEVIGVELLATAAKHVFRTLVACSASISCLPDSIRERGQGASVSQAIRPEVAERTQRRLRISISTKDVAALVEAEPPIPPLQPKASADITPTGADAAAGPTVTMGAAGISGAKSDATCSVYGVSSALCSEHFESEIRLLFMALDVHPELELEAKDEPRIQLSVANRVGFLYLAFWVRLTSVAQQLQALGFSDDSVIGSDAIKDADAGALLSAAGSRALRGAWKSSHSLICTVAHQLRVDLSNWVVRGARPCLEPRSQSGQLRLPLPPKSGNRAELEPLIRNLDALQVVQTASFRTKSVITVEDVVDHILVATPSYRFAKPEEKTALRILLGVSPVSIESWQRGDASEVTDVNSHRGIEMLSARLIELDDMCGVSSCKAPDILTDSVVEAERSPPSSAIAPDTTDFAASLGGATTELANSAAPNPASANSVVRLARNDLSSDFAAAVAAAVRVGYEVQDLNFPSHRVQRVKHLLRFTWWMLLTVFRQEYDAKPPMSSHPLALQATMLLLEVLAVNFDELPHCPADLLIAFWTLRGYAFEKNGQIDMSFVDYVQALQLIDEVWGDPRKLGCHGHPFSLLLVWKLGLVSYCRGDVQSIDKFADYFRSVALHNSNDHCFPWGPLKLTSQQTQQTTDTVDEEQLLWETEAAIWDTEGESDVLFSSDSTHFAGWWRRHDITNTIARDVNAAHLLRGGLGLGDVRQGVAFAEAHSAKKPLPAWSPQRAALRLRELQAVDNGVLSNIQLVPGGTVFSFGFNQLGQLGIGRPTMAATPAKLSLSDNFQAPPPRGGSDVWWSGRPVRVMSLKDQSIRDIACGDSHCVAVDSEGQLFAWGSNECSQIGSVPVSARDSELVASSNPYTETTVVHSPALLIVPSHPTTDDTADGVALASCLLDGSEVVMSRGWERVAPRLEVRFTAVSCGTLFSIALDSRGCLWAWGSGDGGVLGLGVGGLSGRATPTRLSAFDPKARCTFVTCGSYHVLALVGDGLLFSWGRAEGGQLGIGEPRIAAHTTHHQLNDSVVCSPLRVLFSRAAADAADAVADAAATAISMAALEAALSDDQDIVPPNAQEANSAGAMELVPQREDSQETFEAQVAEEAESGEAKMWQADPVRLKHAAAGEVHSLVVDTDGSVWSWGWGEFGQLGLGFSGASYEAGVGGSLSKRLMPERVSQSHFGDSAVVFVACGGAFSAAIVEVEGKGGVSSRRAERGGNLFVWGGNEVGQCALPAKRPMEVSVPTKVHQLRNVVVRSLACGVQHAIAVDIDGRAYSWGSGLYGQLGIQTSPPKFFSPPPALAPPSKRSGDIRGSGDLSSHVPTLIQSVSRLHITKAACGAHHSLIVIDATATEQGSTGSTGNPEDGEADVAFERGGQTMAVGTSANAVRQPPPSPIPSLPATALSSGLAAVATAFGLGPFVSLESNRGGSGFVGAEWAGAAQQPKRPGSKRRERVR